ncbi:SDR family oxidoreductase [Magnetospirillum sp. UT-4]|uniref:SDR family oxidoreductase n=1 Tax=Magnetospirillum sp. UT-4 TaxID=2681467 RepID=UPI0013831E54|nr:SDR family oxidoreductase [Magnetospirillum sp. UT-4]CAA7612904.1 Short-chain dehydrogenase/reductase SDR [Magnetospirillum sp. UT-4]
MTEQRVVVITGASAGVGRAVAHAFARQGAAIGLIARDGGALDDVRREVERLGGRALVLAADVADADRVEDAAGRVEAEFGPIDVWVNAAMVTVFAPFDAITPAEYRRATEVTYLGYVHGTMAALKRMKRRDRGAIVQVGSALAYRSIPLQAPYCGAKAAIRAFTDSLRCELLHDHSRVRLTAVHLPAVNTPQFDWALARMPGRPRPVAPVYQPELAAEAIVWAAQSGRREVLLGPATVAAIWAEKFVPGLLDRYLARTNYQAQQRPQQVPPGAPANLFHTVPALHRTHGAFDGEAQRHSLQWTLSRHRFWLAAGVVALGAAFLVAGALGGPAQAPRRKYSATTPPQ